MDDEFALELDDILESIDSAEIMSLYFPTLWKTVVLDTRSNETHGPLVSVMPMVASPQERLKNIRRLRPGFTRVHNLTLIPWVRSIDSLVNHGIWQRIVDRFKRSGYLEAVAACDTVLEELRRLEKSEIAAAITGENYRTIWPVSE